MVTEQPVPESLRAQIPVRALSASRWVLLALRLAAGFVLPAAFLDSLAQRALPDPDRFWWRDQLLEAALFAAVIAIVRSNCASA